MTSKRTKDKKAHPSKHAQAKTVQVKQDRKLYTSEELEELGTSRLSFIVRFACGMKKDVPTERKDLIDLIIRRQKETGAFLLAAPPQSARHPPKNTESEEIEGRPVSDRWMHAQLNNITGDATLLPPKFEDDLRRQVTRIPVKCPAYLAEARLVRIMRDRVFIDAIWKPDSSVVLFKCPISHGLAPAAVRALIILMREHGLQSVDLGAVLGPIRKELLAKDDQVKEETDEEARAFHKLLLFGLDASQRLSEAVVFLAKYLRAHDLLAEWTAPSDAVEDVIRWARSVAILRPEDVRAFRQACRNEWKDVQLQTLVPWPKPTVVMVRAAFHGKPCPERPTKTQATTRIGMLRLIQRLCQHLEPGNEVDLPTKCLTEAKDNGDPTAIVGFSNNTYLSLLDRMERLGYFIPVATNNPRLRRYRLDLRPTGNPALDDAVVEDAERLLASKADDDVEAHLLALTVRQDRTVVTAESQSQ